MDQCKHCIVRGDIKKCISTDCSIHDTWFASDLTRQLAEARSEIARLHKEVKYNYLYQSFLLGQTSKENFKILAIEYAEPLNIDRDVKSALEDSNGADNS